MIAEGPASELGLEKVMDMPTLDPAVKMHLTKVKNLRAGTMHAENLSIPIMSPASFFGTDVDMDGFIGSDFLKFYCFAIDYQKKHLTLLENGVPDSLKKGHRIPFTRHIMIGAPLVDCVIGSEVQTTGMIDTGSPFGFVLPLTFIERIVVPEKIKSKGTVATWPFTAATENYLARIDRLRVGALEIENVVTLFAELPAMTAGSLIGMEFLSRFKVILDYPANEIILIPSDDELFQTNLFSTGLALKTDESGKIVVRGFWGGSPADKAGMQVGDEILEINSKGTDQMKLPDIQRMLEDDRIGTVELKMRSGERQKRIILLKEMLFPEM
jgi:hypothetical protein